LMGNTKSEAREDFWEWKFDTREWRQLESFRIIPRAYHTAVVAGDEMIVFGGRQEYDKCLNDVCIYVVRNEVAVTRSRMKDALRKMQFVDVCIYS
jgi:N-acetylneuraminic acid mutarotase